ncbi:MAG: hypothetical protein HOO86_16490 [Bacteroidales bacterium]|nr:hypothetical protein [Bacteroidales bacterium]
MNIQFQKAMIIEQFKKVDDINLINAIKSMLDFAIKKEKEVYDIPESHQQLVMERFERIIKDPERVMDWDEAKKKLKP